LRPSLARSLALPLLLAVASPALAAWPASPLVNVPLCTADLHQYSPAAVPDGAGGAIVTWYDYRSGLGADIYAQHVLGSGALDPAWPVDGRAICTAQGQQTLPAIVADGAGGAIVSWEDNRSGTYDVYAAHVSGAGVLDPAWPAGGRALTLSTGDQSAVQLASDGAGGAIATWLDYRGASSDIYAQHVLAGGALAPTWPADGLALCTATGSQEHPQLASDGAGGAIVTWQDARGGPTYDVYAQRALASGVVDPAWPANGRAVCTAVNSQTTPTLVADGAGGAIITWEDYRTGFTGDVYAQRVLASGAVDAAWPANGRALCTVESDQRYPQIVSDGAGGGIVTWQDQRASASFHIYAHHVLASGAVDPAWPADGRAVSTVDGGQYTPSLVSDGAGGAIIEWVDYRGFTNADLYAQHVRATGAVDTAWPVDGRAVCLDASDQFGPCIVTDGSGGAILAWDDKRGGDDDIYAQRVASDGTLGAPVAAVSDGGAPLQLAFTPPSPNPATLRTTLGYSLPRASQVRIAVYDASGRNVRTLEEGAHAAGTHAATWDLRDAGGDPVRAGLYFARIAAGGQSAVRRIAVTR
jgi:hypothetical protein